MTMRWIMSSTVSTWMTSKWFTNSSTITVDNPRFQEWIMWWKKIVRLACSLRGSYPPLATDCCPEPLVLLQCVVLTGTGRTNRKRNRHLHHWHLQQLNVGSRRINQHIGTRSRGINVNSDIIQCTGRGGGRAWGVIWAVNQLQAIKDK